MKRGFLLAWLSHRLGWMRGVRQGLQLKPSCVATATALARWVEETPLKIPLASEATALRNELGEGGS